MANTYSQINIHAVFAVRYREALIAADWRDEMFRYISGILRGEAAFPLAVGGWNDHVHIFYEQKPIQATAEVLRTVKSSSAKWINDQGWVKTRFAWQEGYGAFSYSRGQRNDVIQYIMHQEQHHRQKTFRDEYMELLGEFDIPFKDSYLFEFFE